MAHLGPLDPADKGKPKYVLAEALRELLVMTGVNCADYCRLYFVHPTTVSKALGGKEIPTWPFITALVTNATTASRVQHLRADYLNTIKALYDEAIAESPKPIHAKQKLLDEIARQKEVIQALTLQLHALGVQLENLVSSARAMRTGKVLPINTASEPGFLQKNNEIEEMRDSVQRHINELSKELAWQHERLAEAKDLFVAFDTLYAEKGSPFSADDETELLNLDGLRAVGAADEVIPVEVANAMYSELQDQVASLERQLKVANDEVEYLRGRSLWRPPPAEPRHRRRQEAGRPESLFSEDDLRAPRIERRLDGHG